MGSFMRDSDAFTWYMEQDPILRSTVVAVAWLERSPDWDVLVRKLDRSTRLSPGFRDRVEESPGRLATPRWVADEGFDLSWHLRRVDAPAPHTPDTVIDFARTAATSAFDHSRPLWEFTLIEHLEEGRAAMVMKIHHSLMDGLGGMQLALLLFDTEPTLAVADVEEGDGHHAVGSGLTVNGLLYDGERITGLIGGLAAAAVPAALHTARHPVTSVADAVETARSVVRTVAPVSETLSPIMRERGLNRRLDMIDFDLEDLKRAAATASGSVNDGFLAAVTGGLRRYHERHGAPVDNLRVTMPISIRTPDDPVGGNRITLIRFVVPVGDPDPAERIRELDVRCRAARNERSLPLTNGIAATLNLLPRAVVGGMLKHVDFVASDVPGFEFPVYLAGARLERETAFGPTIGCSMNVTLLSYNGTCCAGITIDTAAVGDPEVLVECLREGFEEVLVLAGDHRHPRLPLHDTVRS